MLEKEELSRVLQEYADRLARDCCDDLRLEDTPQNREFAGRLNAWSKVANPIEPPLIEFKNGYAIISDYLIVHYLKHWVHSITD